MMLLVAAIALFSVAAEALSGSGCELQCAAAALSLGVAGAALERACASGCKLQEKVAGLVKMGEGDGCDALCLRSMADGEQWTNTAASLKDGEPREFVQVLTGCKVGCHKSKLEISASTSAVPEGMDDLLLATRAMARMLKAGASHSFTHHSDRNSRVNPLPP